MIINWNGQQRACFAEFGGIVNESMELEIIPSEADELFTDVMLKLLRSLSSEQVEKLFNAI